jgi:hypothetical protein
LDPQREAPQSSIVDLEGLASGLGLFGREQSRADEGLHGDVASFTRPKLSLGGSANKRRSSVCLCLPPFEWFKTPLVLLFLTVHTGFERLE